MAPLTLSRAIPTTKVVGKATKYVAVKGRGQRSLVTYDLNNLNKPGTGAVVSTQDKNDPNYVYGQVSGGSYQELKTTNPAVYNTWYVGAIITCEMEVTPAE